MFELKKNLKRMTACLCTLALALSLTGAASAAAFNDAASITQTKAVTMLTELKVMEGKPGGNFDPAGTVTRAEMAKIMTLLLNGGNDPTAGTELVSTYSDTTEHWALAYIEYCTFMGIVSGNGDGTFSPDGSVTAVAAVKMLLCGLGYRSAEAGLEGENWRLMSNVLAADHLFYEGLKINPNEAISRENLAKLVCNALGATIIDYTKNEAGTQEIPVPRTGITLLYRFGRSMTDGVLDPLPAA